MIEKPVANLIATNKKALYIDKCKFILCGNPQSIDLCVLFYLKKKHVQNLAGHVNVVTFLII